MSITSLSHNEAITAVESATEVSAVREMATELDITFSGNTGLDTLKGKVTTKLNDLAEKTPIVENQDENSKEVSEKTSVLFSTDNDNDKDIQIAEVITNKEELSVEQLLVMDPTKVKDNLTRRLVIRAQALKLRRVSIMNLDPADASLSGTIVTLHNKYTGKVAKYVPFGEGSENGYHIPQIIYDHLKTQKFVLRREKKGTSFGVKKYVTSLVPKYQIIDLPELTKDELAGLAQRQAASQAIG